MAHRRILYARIQPDSRGRPHAVFPFVFSVLRFHCAGQARPVRAGRAGRTEDAQDGCRGAASGSGSGARIFRTFCIAHAIRA